MTLQVLGAGLPRTATSSLGMALDQLLGGHRHRMSAIAGHPFDLGEGWRMALAGGSPNWEEVFDGYIAAVDWPASAFWQELSQVYPDALVILSVRDSAQVWYESLAATILPVTRLDEGRDLVDLFVRFTGTTEWDNPVTLVAAYERHNAAVRESIPARRLLEWNAKEGWEPLCRALEKPVPDLSFPWANKKEDWG